MGKVHSFGFDSCHWLNALNYVVLVDDITVALRFGSLWKARRARIEKVPWISLRKKGRIIALTAEGTVVYFFS